MSGLGKCLLLAVACAAAFHTATAAERARPATHSPALETGTIDDAPFRIDIPADWNGDLVLLAHGFEPVGVPRSSPMSPNDATPVFLAGGYAVAQSSYASQGWAVRDAIDDTERLRQRFVQRYGAPRRTYLVGFSMGGGVAAASLEMHPDAHDGALSLCGVNVPGARLADELFITLAAFDYFFPHALGAAVGLTDPAAASSNQGEVMSAIASALAGEPAIAATLARYLEVPVEAVPGVVSLHYLVFQDISKRAGGLPVDNRMTRYRGFGDDAAFNAGVRRHAGNERAMQYVATAPSLTGRPGKPLVIQYNQDDPTVTPRFRMIHAAMTSPASGKDQVLTLPPVGEGHCGFSPEQIGKAFRTLTDWVETGIRPDSD